MFLGYVIDEDQYRNLKVTGTDGIEPSVTLQVLEEIYRKSKAGTSNTTLLCNFQHPADKDRNWLIDMEDLRYSDSRGNTLNIRKFSVIAKVNQLCLTNEEHMYMKPWNSLMPWLLAITACTNSELWHNLLNNYDRGKESHQQYSQYSRLPFKEPRQELIEKLDKMLEIIEHWSS